MFLKNNLNLRKVGFYELSHTTETLKKRGYLGLHVDTEETGDLLFHRPYTHLYLFLVCGVLGKQSALKFHNCLNDQLELVNFRLFFIWDDVIVSKNLCYNLMQLYEGVRKDSFNHWDLHNFAVFQVHEGTNRLLVRRQILFHLRPRNSFTFEMLRRHLFYFI